MRSIYLHKDKSIFKLDELPVDKFAESLGLPGTPKIKFLSKAAMKQRKNASRAVEDAQAQVQKEKVVKGGSSSEEEEDATSGSSSSESDNDHTPNEAKVSNVPKVRTKYDRMFERKNQNVLSEHYNKLIEDDDDGQGGQSDSSDGFIQLKRANHDLDLPGPSTNTTTNTSTSISLPPSDTTLELSKRKLKLSRTKRTIANLAGGTNTKLIFDDEGNPHALYEMANPEAWYREQGGLQGANEAGRRFAELESGKMRVVDVRDREEAKEKKREKKRKRKEKETDRQVNSPPPFSFN
jgi:ATP-dependent RNA helicase DDX10/DBP4